MLSHWLILIFKDFKILLERQLIPLTFVIFDEVKDSVGKVRYPTDIYYILKIWRFCWKDTWSHRHLLFLTFWRLYCKDTLDTDIEYFLQFEDSVENIPYPIDVYYCLRIWRICWKNIFSRWRLLFLKNLKIALERYLIILKFIIF